MNFDCLVDSNGRDLINKVNLSLWLSCLHLQALSVPQLALFSFLFLNFFFFNLRINLLSLLKIFFLVEKPPFSLEDLSSHKNHTSARSSRGCNKNKIIIIEDTEVKKIPNNYGKN